MRAMGLVAILAVTSSASAIAQEPPLQPGQRVRVTVPSLDLSKHQDTFQRTVGDTLVLSSASYALSDITRLDVHRGSKRGTLRGFSTGVAVGAGIGLAMGSSSDCYESREFCLQTPMYVAVLGVGGGLVGAAIGHAMKWDKWEQVPLNRLRLSIAPTRNGFGLGARIAF